MTRFIIGLKMREILSQYQQKYFIKKIDRSSPNLSTLVRIHRHYCNDYNDQYYIYNDRYSAEVRSINYSLEIVFAQKPESWQVSYCVMFCHKFFRNVGQINNFVYNLLNLFQSMVATECIVTSIVVIAIVKCRVKIRG